MLDQAASASASSPPAWVTGDGPTGDDVVLRMRDAASPARLDSRDPLHGREYRLLVTDIEAVVGPHRRAGPAGAGPGWRACARPMGGHRRLGFSPLSSRGSSAPP